MTRAEARTAIASKYENAAGAPTSTDLNSWIDIENKLLRRSLARIVPSLYTATDTAQTITGTTITLPSDFETLVRLERQYGQDWLPVDVGDGLSPQIGDLNQLEQGAAISLGPTVLTPGTYRVVYIQAPVTLTADSGAGGTLLVPPGCEDIIVERCAAQARVKLEEDPSPHLARAEAIWVEQGKSLKRRYGRHPVPGLRRVRAW